MKKISLIFAALTIPLCGSALEWTEGLVEKLKSAKEINCTIDFREGIYNGNDSASLSKALGHESGWEIAFFNQVRNNLCDGVGYQSPGLCKPNEHRKFNIHVIVKSVGEHGEMQAQGLIWTDNIENASKYDILTGPGRWNDFDKLLLESSKDLMKPAVVNNAKYYAEIILDLKKEASKKKEKTDKETPKYLKDKAGKRKEGAEFNKYFELKSGDAQILNNIGPAIVETDYSDATFGNDKFNKCFADRNEMESIASAYFASAFNEKSKGMKIVTDPSQARYRIVVRPEYISMAIKGTTMTRAVIPHFTAQGTILVYPIGSNSPVAEYSFENIEAKPNLAYRENKWKTCVKLIENIGKKFAAE